MTVAEVEAHVDAIVAQLPTVALDAMADVTIHVARDRQDLEVLKGAISEAGVGAVAIPQDFRAMFLGHAIENEEDDVATGVIVLNAEKLLTEEDVNLTLLHEIGHALGYNEYEVAELGLE